MDHSIKVDFKLKSYMMQTIDKIDFGEIIFATGPNLCQLATDSTREFVSNDDIVKNVQSMDSGDNGCIDASIAYFGFVCVR